MPRRLRSPPFPSSTCATADRCADAIEGRDTRARACATSAWPGCRAARARCCRSMDARDAPLAHALALALRGGGRGDRDGARLSGHLVSQRLLPVGLHRARARGRRRALARAHARLAVPGARPPPRSGAHAAALPAISTTSRWPGYVGRPDRLGARPFRRRHQPGAAEAAHAASVAAALRHRAECARALGGIRFIPPDHLLRQVFETCRDFRRGAAAPGNDADRAPGDLYAGRLRARRALRDRAHRGRLCEPRRRHGRGQRLAARRGRRGRRACAPTSCSRAATRRPPTTAAQRREQLAAWPGAICARAVSTG